MDNKLILLAHYEIILSRWMFLRWMSRVMLLILLLLGLVFGVGDSYSASFMFGFFFILLPFGILADLFRLFLRSAIGQESKRQHSDSGGLNYRSARLLALAQKRADRLWIALLQEEGMQFMLFRLGVPTSSIRPLFPRDLTYETWIKQSQQLATHEQSELLPKHFFEALQTYEAFDQIWRQFGITSNERSEVWQWYERMEARIAQRHRGFVDTLRFSGGIGRDWASGYTRALELFAHNISDEVGRLGYEISLVGHREEKTKVLEYLSRSHQHNVMLLGQEGIGKQRVIYSLASDFILGKVPLSLKYKHLYRLDVGALVSSASPEELTQRLQAVLQEAASVGNVVLVIPDFHLLVGGNRSKALGVVDASAVLAPYLQSTQLQLIGIMEPDAYYAFIKPNPSLEPFLLPVEVKEINAREALEIIEDEVFAYEMKHHHYFMYQSLEKIIQLAEQHMHDKPFPEKAMQLLDEVAGALSEDPQKIIFPQQVERVISQKLKIPIGVATQDERDVLNNLEDLIRQRIIGQEEAVKAVADALRRARAGLHSGQRPIGTFLFLGPTGVGKTEMAKTIAALYYKNDKAFIRLDMSEYQTPESLEKLVGTSTAPGLLTTAVTDQPFSVVLLDEIEKASLPVRNLFLQILDDGRVTDGYGKHVDFTHTMIIATSNAGAQLIHESVRDKGTVPPGFKATLLEYLQQNGIFSPEWLNRFDASVVFLPLTSDEIRKVAALQVHDLVQRLRGHNIYLEVNEDVYDFLIERGYDPEFGARPMRRAVQDTIESVLAKLLLNDTSEGERRLTITRSLLEEQRAPVTS